MITHKLLRAISLLAYLSICLQGMFIGLPFALYLPIAAFIEWGTWAQVAALSALVGFFILLQFRLSGKHKSLGSDLLVFGLLLLLIIERITSVSILLFNYAAFILPCSIFIVLYPLSSFLAKEARQQNNQWITTSV